MLLNLIELGSILDVRRYGDLWDENGYITNDQKTQYILAKRRSKEFRSWLCHHCQLHLITHNGFDSDADGLTSQSRLPELSAIFLSQQCKTLIVHKVEMEERDIHGEDRAVTAVAIRKAIEEDFAEDGEFMGRWPSKLEEEKGKEKEGEDTRNFKHLKIWLASWNQAAVRTYSFPSPPEGCSYSIQWSD